MCFLYNATNTECSKSSVLINIYILFKKLSWATRIQEWDGFELTMLSSCIYVRIFILNSYRIIATLFDIEKLLRQPKLAEPV